MEVDPFITNLVADINTFLEIKNAAVKLELGEAALDCFYVELKSLLGSFDSAVLLKYDIMMSVREKTLDYLDTYSEQHPPAYQAAPTRKQQKKIG